MDHFIVNPTYQQMWDESGWRSVGNIVEHFLPDYRNRRPVTVRRVSISDNGATTDAFFKLYHHRPGGWRFWMRSSKARREFENYAVLARFGVPGAEAIMCGEERDRLGRLRRSFILTRAVPDALGLDEFFKTKPISEERRGILKQLAGYLHRLHTASFFYHDLVWRNILVSRDAVRVPQLFLIDCPRGGFSRFGSRHKRLRDLASLDKCGAEFCSRSERLQFLAQYLGKNPGDEEVRALARACIDYRRARWPEDWHGK